jgi:hypothetical protein
MLDVREFAYLKLKEAKETFQRNRALPPVGYLLCAEGITAYEFDFGSKEARREAENAFQRDAREKKAIAAITITDSGFQIFPPWEKEKPDIKMTEIPAWQRQAMAAGGGRCISMDIEVPGQRIINVMVPYSMTKSGDIKFEKAEEQPIDFEGPAPPKSREEEGPLN